MIKGVKSATIWSEDLNNLLPFYRDTVGLPVSLSTEGFVVLGNEAGVTVALGTHSEVHGKASDPYRHILAFETDDIKAEIARLKKAGCEFLDEVIENTPVSFATFRDPEGNLLQLLQFNQ